MLVSNYEDLKTLIEIGNEENDESLIPEVKELKDIFLSDYETIRISTLLNGEYDKNNAILTLHSIKHTYPIASLCSTCSRMKC